MILKNEKLRAISLQGAIKKVQYWYHNIGKRKIYSNKIIAHLGSTNITFADCFRSNIVVVQADLVMKFIAS